MKELVVISGRGGTGKTTLVASFAALADRAVLADCDVDSSDLPLVMSPSVRERAWVPGEVKARIRPDRCTACGRCHDLCRFDAVRREFPRNGAQAERFSIDPIACEGCGVCASFCPEDAISLVPGRCGEWFISETRFGPMVHARLAAAATHSGMLVTAVREQAERIAERDDLDLILIDGAPGIGCPVISSIAGADLVLVVVEPSPGGVQDLPRVSDLTMHFGIETLVCVNKWDVNSTLAFEIDALANERNLNATEMIRYDRTVVDALMSECSVVEVGRGGAAADIRRVWDTVGWTLARQHERTTARRLPNAEIPQGRPARTTAVGNF